MTTRVWPGAPEDNVNVQIDTTDLLILVQMRQDGGGFAEMKLYAAEAQTLVELLTKAITAVQTNEMAAAPAAQGQEAAQ